MLAVLLSRNMQFFCAILFLLNWDRNFESWSPFPQWKVFINCYIRVWDEHSSVICAQYFEECFQYTKLFTMIFSQWIAKMNHCPHEMVTSYWSAWKIAFWVIHMIRWHELYSSVTVPQSSNMLHRQFINHYVIPQFIEKPRITSHFPLNCWNVFYCFDIIICSKSNILNQFIGSQNLKTLRQEMRSHVSNVSPEFPISGNSHWARWLPYYWKLSTPCLCGPAPCQGCWSFPRHLVISWRSSIIVA